MGTIRSAKKKRDVGPKCLALAFFQRASSLFTKKLFSISPAPILESPQVSASIDTANLTSQNRCEAFFQLKYTFCFQLAKMNVAKNF